MKFKGVERVRKNRIQVLRGEFEEIKMMKNFSRLFTNVNQEKLYGEKIKDLKIIEKVYHAIRNSIMYYLQ